MVDARLVDGSRVNAIIPNTALDGPLRTFDTTFSVDSLTMDNLLEYKSASPQMAKFIDCK